MGSRGSDYDRQAVQRVNQMIDELVQPKNQSISQSKTEHILGYIEASLHKDHDLVEMMDNHAQIQFADSSVDENGTPKQSSKYWKDFWSKTQGKKSGTEGGFVSKDFREIRKELLNNMSQQDLKQLKKVVMQKLPGKVTDVSVSNGEIKINYANGTSTVFDPQVSMWPF